MENNVKILQPNKLIMTAIQLLLPIIIYIVIQLHVSWTWWLATFVFYFVYCCIGNNIALHKFYSHKQFDINPVTEIFFAWASAISCLGSPISYAIPHLVHHKYPDTDLDPHGPTVGIKSLLYYFHRHLHINDRTIYSKRVVELAKRYKLLHKYYWGFVVLNIILFYLIGGINAVIFCWALPACLTLWAVSLAIYLQHNGGSASNNRYYSWFGWGEGLHLNHHLSPMISNTAMHIHEFDYSHAIARLFATKFR